MTIIYFVSNYFIISNYYFHFVGVLVGIGCVCVAQPLAFPTQWAFEIAAVVVRRRQRQQPWTATATIPLTSLTVTLTTTPTTPSLLPPLPPTATATTVKMTTKNSWIPTILSTLLRPRTPRTTRFAVGE